MLISFKGQIIRLNNLINLLTLHHNLEKLQCGQLDFAIFEFYWPAPYLSCPTRHHKHQKQAELEHYILLGVYLMMHNYGPALDN